MVDKKQYRFIWDFSKGNPTWTLPRSMSSLRKYYEKNGYTVITEDKKLYIKRG
jgi:hypothetical protein